MIIIVAYLLLRTKIKKVKNEKYTITYYSFELSCLGDLYLTLSSELKIC